MSRKLDSVGVLFIKRSSHGAKDICLFADLLQVSTEQARPRTYKN